MSEQPRRQPAFVILGAGPAGLAAACKLVERGWRNVTVLERADRVGGNAGSFVIDGIPVDFGSHRLHPVCPPPVMADIRRLLGDDLLDRERRPVCAQRRHLCRRIGTPSSSLGSATR